MRKIKKLKRTERIRKITMRFSRSVYDATNRNALPLRSTMPVAG
jgi:hypothetical protein